MHTVGLCMYVYMYLHCRYIIIHIHAQAYLNYRNKDILDMPILMHKCTHKYIIYTRDEVDLVLMEK